MSVDIATLGLEVRSDGVVVASDRLKRLTEEGKRAEGSTDSLSAASSRLTSYLKAAAAALATWKLSEYIKDATLLAARVETLGVVLKVVGNNAGYTGAQMEAYVNQVKKMGITTQESMSSLIKMASAQMDLAKASQLARVAQDAAVIGGINSSEAFGRLIHGIRSGEVEILRTIGINVQFEQGYKSLAATLGKTSEQLTATEKTASRMNQVLDFGKNIAGAYEASMGTAGKQMQSMSRYTEELKLKIGQTFTPALAFAVSEITRTLKEMDGALADNKSTVATLGEAFKNTFISVAAEVQRVSMLIDLAGGSLTAFAARALKISEVTIRFMTIGQFGDWFKDKSESMAALNKELEARYKEGEANLQRLANLSVPGAMPTTDYSKEQEKAALAASKSEQERKESEARAAAAKLAAEETAKWKDEAAGLRAEIASLNPALTDYDKTVLNLNAQYDTLIKQYPKHRAELQGLRAEHLAAARAAEEWKNSLAVQDNMNSAWEGEQKLREERAQTAAQLQVQLAEQQGLREEALKLQIELENAALREKGIYEGQVKELKDKVDAYRMAAEAQKEAEQFAALKVENRSLATSLISDPYEQEKQALKDRYDMEMELQQKALENSEANAQRGAEIIKKMSLLQQKYIMDTAKVQAQANLSMRERTVDMGMSAANVFAAMAEAQNTSSKEGFEAAKKMNAAATITSTAAAVMNQMSAGDPYTAWARAAAAAAMGAVQLANILKTDYEGGGSIAGVSGGSVGGGSGNNGNVESGGTLGYRVQSVQDQQTAESLQRLADASDNASLAIGRVADGLETMAELFGTGAAKELSGSLVVDGSRFWGMAGQNSMRLGYANGGITATRPGSAAVPVPAETQRGLSSYLTTIQQNIIRSAIAIGTSANFGAAAPIPSRTILTQGRTTEEIQKDIEAFFTEVANTLAKTTEGLEAYRFAGEGQYDTLIRLATSLQTVNELFELTGHRLVASSLAGADAAYRLVDAFGGLDKFNDVLNDYFSGMFTEQEQDARILWQSVRQVNVAFEEMGLAVPSTTAGFRSLVDSLDVTTEYGAGLYVSLMNIAPTFAEMIKLSEKFTEESRKYGIQLRDLQMRELELKGEKDSKEYRELLQLQREAELSTMDASLAAIQKRIWALEDEKAATEAVTAALSGTVSIALDAANTLKRIQTNPQLSTKSPEKLYYDLKGELVAAMADPSQYGKVSTIAQDFLNASRGFNASGSAYVDDYNFVTQALKNISGMTADPSLTALDKHTTLLESIDKTLKDGDLAGLADLVPQLASWSWLAGEIAKLAGIPQHASGGYYAGGLALMGERGAELVDSSPGYVYRAEETKALFEMAKRGIAADNYSAELVAEIRELRREVAELRGTAETGNRIAAAVGTELSEIGQEGNRQRGQMVKGERMRGAA